MEISLLQIEEEGSTVFLDGILLKTEIIQRPLGIETPTGTFVDLVVDPGKVSLEYFNRFTGNEPWIRIRYKNDPECYIELALIADLEKEETIFNMYAEDSIDPEKNNWVKIYKVRERFSDNRYCFPSPKYVSMHSAGRG
jgi:hypothetical protein